MNSKQFFSICISALAFATQESFAEGANSSSKDLLIVAAPGTKCEANPQSHSVRCQAPQAQSALEEDSSAGAPGSNWGMRMNSQTLGESGLVEMAQVFRYTPSDKSAQSESIVNLGLAKWVDLSARMSLDQDGEECASFGCREFAAGLNLQVFQNSTGSSTITLHPEMARSSSGDESQWWGSLEITYQQDVGKRTSLLASVAAAADVGGSAVAVSAGLGLSYQVTQKWVVYGEVMLEADALERRLDQVLLNVGVLRELGKGWSLGAGAQMAVAGRNVTGAPAVIVFVQYAPGQKLWSGKFIK